jgi:hypothetical protein
MGKDMIEFTQAHLKKLCQINNFVIPNVEMIFLGIRGGQPINIVDNSSYQTQSIKITPINYTDMNCTIAQWNLKTGKVAIFRGSTVPYITGIQSARVKNGQGANQMIPGFYYENGFVKGVHFPRVETAHEAFIQAGPRPVRRTGDDNDYDNLDRIEFGTQWDNNHAAWSLKDGFSSLGCQVVAGLAKCQKRAENLGPWKTYHDNGYALNQKLFPYILTEALELQLIVNSTEKLTQKLRYGSSGQSVKTLQEALKKMNYYSGPIDGNFGWNTLNSVLIFQTKVFGADQDDGIVGPVTSKALGFNLPEL